MRRALLSLLLLTSAALTACSFNIDSMIFNARHCSIVGPETCEDEEEYWDRICVTCDEEYDWTLDYEWQDTTLTAGQTVRAIDPDTVENVSLPTVDGLGELDVYFFPAHGDRADLENTLILQNHGNFASIEHYAVRTRYFHEYGADVLVWDYRGYGKSEPETTPSAPQFMADAAQILEYAGEIADDPSKIVLYGQSVGAIPAVEQAVLGEAGSAGAADPCALILETPFTSTSEIARSISGVSMPGGFLSTGYFENDVKLTNYTGPLLAISAGNEDRFPREGVQVLVDAAAGPTTHWFHEDAYHGLASGGVPEQGLTEYFDQLDAFFDAQGPDCLSDAGGTDDESSD